MSRGRGAPAVLVFADLRGVRAGLRAPRGVADVRDDRDELLGVGDAARRGVAPRRARGVAGLEVRLPKDDMVFVRYECTRVL